ncbi:response regulator transcription factor [Ruminiclostridium josui]|uniref:response regulator transcription factor n=1 Tax=Ruminiclostridium josui TaxID=1499 RepID=UPI0004656516|nr:response regulator transcription factor [Ruminiclostridium josui]
MKKISVAIVEDDPVWASSLKTFLDNEEDLCVVAIASTQKDAMEMAENKDVDIILMDINLSENNMDGVYAAAEISQTKNVKIIMLTSIESEEVIRNSFTAGAVNYILKSNYTEIPSAIRAVHNKVSPVEVLLKEYSRMKEEEQVAALSNAEKEILNLVRKGYSQSKISEVLFKSPGTIKAQINKLLKKMNVSNCKQAIKKINSKGILK